MHVGGTGTQFLWFSRPGIPFQLLSDSWGVKQVEELFSESFMRGRQSDCQYKSTSISPLGRLLD